MEYTYALCATIKTVYELLFNILEYLTWNYAACDVVRLEGSLIPSVPINNGFTKSPKEKI